MTIDERVAELVAKAPPLTEQERARLRQLLSLSPHSANRPAQAPTSCYPARELRRGLPRQRLRPSQVRTSCKTAIAVVSPTTGGITQMSDRSRISQRHQERQPSTEPQGGGGGHGHRTRATDPARRSRPRIVNASTPFLTSSFLSSRAAIAR
jgi:hypothetical protein